MKRLWMKSLTGQWIALLLLSLVLSQVVFLAIYRDEQLRTVLLLRRDEFISRTASVARLLDAAEPDLHEDIVNAASTSAVRFWLATGPEADPLTWQKQALERLMGASRPPPPGSLELQGGL
ncbi:MAG TPA: two-component sensor histidine kinase, partial [Haloferula sp.]